MKKSAHIIFALLVLTAGCKKFDKDININPNLPTKASNAQLLTYAITQIQYTIESPFAILFTQQLSEKIYTDASRYTTINFDWDWIYSGPLMNLQTILNTKNFNINDGSQNNQEAVARILKAYYFWHITDRWGDAPYSEALKGKDNFTPKYDAQQDIYNGLQNELKEAAAQIDNGNPVAGDILYNGDMDNWRRLANSMRILMALRLSKIDPDKGKTEFADALAAGVFTDNSQNAVYRHIAETANENYWYNVFDVLNRQWYCISEPLVSYMKPWNDPRLPVFADPATSSGDYVGMPYGVDGNAAGDIQGSDVSFLGQQIRTQDASSYVLTYAEILFAEAEAAKLGWIPGGDTDAKMDYDAAIEASVRQWNQDDVSALPAYLAQTGVVYDPANALMQIGYQRWVHLYMNGYEAWAEWRRTGYPVLSPAPDNGGLAIPRREGYPSSEPNINPANYKNAIAAQPGFNGKDDLNGRVWWDK